MISPFQKVFSMKLNPHWWPVTTSLRRRWPHCYANKTTGNIWNWYWLWWRIYYKGLVFPAAAGFRWQLWFAGFDISLFWVSLDLLFHCEVFEISREDISFRPSDCEIHSQLLCNSLFSLSLTFSDKLFLNHTGHLNWRSKDILYPYLLNNIHATVWWS